MARPNRGSFAPDGPRLPGMGGRTSGAGEAISVVARGSAGADSWSARLGERCSLAVEEASHLLTAWRVCIYVSWSRSPLDCFVTERCSWYVSCAAKNLRRGSEYEQFSMSGSINQQDLRNEKHESLQSCAIKCGPNVAIPAILYSRTRGD